jgi:hypothetical protein
MSDQPYEKLCDVCGHDKKWKPSPAYGMHWAEHSTKRCNMFIMLDVRQLLKTLTNIENSLPSE